MAHDIILKEGHFDREQTASYLWWKDFWGLLGISVASCGFVLPLWIAWIFGLGSWYVRRATETLRYNLQPGRLVIERWSWWTLKRSAIPLEKITDLSISQGILERRYGFWRLNVQTAGTGGPTAEGVIIGLDDPHAFREAVLEARDSMVPDALAAEEQKAATASSSEMIARLDRLEALLGEIAANTRARA